MRDNLYQVVGFVLVVIIALLGFGAFLHVLVTLPLQGKEAEWVGAIGIILTLIGTICLATTETRRREKNEFTIARLRGASLVLRLVHAEATVKDVAGILEEAAQIDRGPCYLKACRRKLSGIELWTIDELIPLMPLPNNTAVKLAEAADLLSTTSKLLDRKIADQEKLSSADRMLFARELHDHLTYIFRLIDEARFECRAAAKALHLSSPNSFNR